MVVVREPWWKGYIPLPICVGLVGLGYYVVSELVTFEIPLLVAAVMQALSFIIIIFAIAHTYWWPRRELKIDDNRIYFAIGLSRTTIPWSAVQQMSLVELTQSTRPAARSKTQWYLRLELSTSESAGSAQFPLRFDTHTLEQSLSVPDNIFAFSVARLPGGAEAVEAALRQGGRQLTIERREIQQTGR